MCIRFFCFWVYFIRILQKSVSTPNDSCTGSLSSGLHCSSLISLFSRSPWEKFPGEHHIKALRWDKVKYSWTSTNGLLSTMALATKACLHSAKKNLPTMASFFSQWWKSQDWCVHDLSRQSHFDFVLFILLQ